MTKLFSVSNSPTHSTKCKPSLSIPRTSMESFAIYLFLKSVISLFHIEYSPSRVKTQTVQENTAVHKSCLPFIALKFHSKVISSDELFEQFRGWVKLSSSLTFSQALLVPSAVLELNGMLPPFGSCFRYRIPLKIWLAQESMTFNFLKSDLKRDSLYITSLNSLLPQYHISLTLSWKLISLTVCVTRAFLEFKQGRKGESKSH